mmetsp:Transcript_11536/g.28278  ORF Transcript_11536/g.28278 Transcript_11536/m.28278 type:complete len:167 (-) Transcript_11536:1019-1519(-)
MSVHTSLIKVLSWLTTITTRDFHTLPVLSVRCSHNTPSIARWLVGSSSSSTSGLANSAAARATRTRHPPERSFILRARRSSEKPRDTSIARARPSAPSASMATRRSCTVASLSTASVASLLSSPLALASSSFSSRSSVSRSTSALSTMSCGLSPSFISARGISWAT